MGIITPIKSSSPAVSKLLTPDFADSRLNARLFSNALAIPTTNATTTIAINAIMKTPNVGAVLEVLPILEVNDTRKTAIMVMIKATPPTMLTISE